MLDGLDAQMCGVGASSVLRGGGAIAELWWRQQYNDYWQWIAGFADEHRDLCGAAANIDPDTVADAHPYSDTNSDAELLADSGHFRRHSAWCE